MTDTQKKLLSGIQPTGRPHIGNYFGLMRRFDDYPEHQRLAMVVDYHALTTIRDGDMLRQNTLDVVIDYLALGIDPEQIILFKQSDVPELTELTWIFNCLITTAYLERAHAFKDKVTKGIESSVGLFDYPVLMACDILMFDTNIVPVGKDQQQHVEMARDIAQKFNNAYGETFVLPEAHINEDVAVVPGIDGQKMSKSYGNTIPLFATDAELKKAIMSIETDSKAPEEPKSVEGNTIFELYTLFANETEVGEMKKGFAEGGLGYGDAKKELLRVVSEFIAPLREKREAIAADPEAVKKIIENGGERARAIAKAKMMEVRQKVGLSE